MDLHIGIFLNKQYYSCSSSKLYSSVFTNHLLHVAEAGHSGSKPPHVTDTQEEKSEELSSADPSPFPEINFSQTS